jgi:hypothetical protein
VTEKRQARRIHRIGTCHPFRSERSEVSERMEAAGPDKMVASQEGLGALMCGAEAAAVGSRRVGEGRNGRLIDQLVWLPRCRLEW